MEYLTWMFITLSLTQTATLVALYFMYRTNRILSNRISTNAQWDIDRWREQLTINEKLVRKLEDEYGN